MLKKICYRRMILRLKHCLEGFSKTYFSHWKGFTKKQQNLSQDELAKKAGVSRTIIGNYERNTNTPSIEVLIKLAKVFNVSVDFLIGEGELAALDKDLQNGSRILKNWTKL